MNLFKQIRAILIPTVLFCMPAVHSYAQARLDKRITISIQQKPLSQALNEIGKKGGFSFSYNTNIIKRDSVINLYAEESTVRQILDRMLGDGYDYMESGKYIILVRKAVAPAVRIYMVSGYIKDEETKGKVSNVSIYESNQLVSTLTDSNGFFKLRLKDKYSYAVLIISKQLYRDTQVVVQPGVDQQVNVTIAHEKVAELSPFVVTNHVEKTWLGKFFLSSKEKIQSMNLSGFFAKKPIQFSLTPGLGTHGQMGAQVVNKLSVNAIGGYTAGINGLELAGVFNIDKKEVKYVQAAGVFNTVGGDVRGVQLAGIHNQDLDSVSGAQGAGISNYVRGGVKGLQLAGIINMDGKTVRGVQGAGIINIDHDSMKGMQMAGLHNGVTGSMSGVQTAGLTNIVNGRTDGMQISGLYNGVEGSVCGFQAAGLVNKVGGKVVGLQLAGLANIADSAVSGLQCSGILNKTSHLKGVQFGLVNIVDSSSGVMIGLVNIVKHGWRRLTFSADETLPFNLSYKAGSRMIYSILTAGVNPFQQEKAYAWGFGIGHESVLNGKLSLLTEFTVRNFYLGDWDNTPAVYRLQPSLQWTIARHFAIDIGPTLSIYDRAALRHPASGYKTALPSSGYSTFSIGNSIAWIGASISINFF